MKAAIRAVVDALTEMVARVVDALLHVHAVLTDVQRRLDNRSRSTIRRREVALYDHYGPQCWDVRQLPPYRRVPYRD